MKYRLSISLLCLLFALPILAQNTLPEKPKPKTVTHHFFDWKNDVELSAIAATTGLQIASAKNPSPKTVVVPLAEFGATVGTMAFAHYMEKSQPNHGRVWHFVERAAPVVTAGFQIHTIVNNYAHQNRLHGFIFGRP